jgi:hypothetical protein
MPSPSSALLTLRPDLAASFQQYDIAMSWAGFIAPKVLPVVPVLSQAGNFGVIPLDQLLMARGTARAPGAAYSRGQTTFSPSTYACKENGFEEPVDDREAKMYVNYLAAEQFAALRARDAVLRNYESRVVTLLNDTSVNFSGAKTGTVATSWKTIASSTPVADIVKAVKAVYANSGLMANTVVMGWNAYQNVRQASAIIDRIKYSGADDPKNITVNMLAGLFGVDNVYIAGAQKNAANEGATASLSQLWDDDKVFVGRVATGGDFKEPCVGRTFHWSEDGSSPTGTVESYRDETVRSTIIRVRMDSDEKILYSAAGYVLTAANA